ncbi:LysR family transcriptional regulator [Pseudorhodoferax aquiterrae]|uniref:LysR family transcriptional regulator n=1 Tax=Pseudorhodoferax aquiterrae TaxID=747304 RepID=A0ABQ3FY78_9BURK|nr:LysR family transcriptional regulator [Pseudorhodoferax aquiterrae]GHC75939.1 LysR family transcriptional regulator [Pseudorhodoferax aquiterrae]
MPSTPVRRPRARRGLNQRVLQEVALRHFLEVARAGSVTEAAARLEVAPSAVSRQIGRLEQELDTLLFERRARGMVLNSAGELLAAHARRAWLDIERVADEILALRGLRQGEVRIVATEGFAYDFLPSLVAGFQQRNPGIRFTLDMSVQSEVSRRVREGQADLGVTVSLRSERGIDVVLRHPAPILAVVAAGHALAARRHLALAQLVAHPLALPAASSTLRQLLDISASRQGLALEAAMTSDHLYPLIQYVAHTQAVTFCGELALRQLLHSGSIAAVPLRDREMNERHFEVQAMAGRHLPEAARAFVAHLREALERDA